MKRLYIALTLLLVSFLAALDLLKLRTALAAIDIDARWVELALAAGIVAFFLKRTRLRLRLPVRTPGLRLLAGGIALYALAMAAITGLLATVTREFVPDAANPWAAMVPQVLTAQHMQPVLLAAQVLLLVGAFRVLASLEPHESDSDF